MLSPEKQATLTWLILITLTLISVYLGQTMQASGWLALAVTLTIMVKGQQIVDVYMGLRRAPRRWRALLMSYVLLVPGIIGLVYAFS